MTQHPLGQVVYILQEVYNTSNLTNTAEKLMLI